MKNLSVILFAVLFLALAVLYFLHFSGTKKVDQAVPVSESPAQGLAYVNIDTVIFRIINENSPGVRTYVIIS